jgi:D-glycero-alpha-D-manno-heptose 1-phosphate guanylyltransferase
MQVIILAGGQGTRLKSVVKDIPKVMAPIDGNPFLNYIINNLKRYELTKIIISTGYKSDTIEDYYGNNFIYSKELTPLGTGGAIAFAKPFLTEETFIVINGDTFFDIDYKDLIDKHIRTKAKITVALTKVKDTSRYIRFRLDKENRIVEMEGRGIEKPGVSIGGIFIFNKEVLEDFPIKGPLEEIVFPKYINNGLFGWVYDGFFIDIGIPEDYERCQKYLPKFSKLFSESEKLMKN